MISFELTIKNIPKIESKTIIGYSNFANLLSIIKCFDAFKTIVAHVVPSMASFVPKYGMTDCELAER